MFTLDRTSSLKKLHEQDTPNLNTEVDTPVRLWHPTWQNRSFSVCMCVSRAHIYTCTHAQNHICTHICKGNIISTVGSFASVEDRVKPRLQLWIETSLNTNVILMFSLYENSVLANSLLLYRKIFWYSEQNHVLMFLYSIQHLMLLLWFPKSLACPQ